MWKLWITQLCSWLTWTYVRNKVRIIHSMNMCVTAIKYFLTPTLNIPKIFIGKPSYSETQSIPKFLYLYFLYLSEFLCRIYSLYKCFVEQKILFVTSMPLLQRDLSIKILHSWSTYTFETSSLIIFMPDWPLGSSVSKLIAQQAYYSEVLEIVVFVFQ